MIVTFYSFKGGVGRSLAMANVAEILADTGYRVVVCDWDLEAPGLERYFADTKQESDNLTSQPGLMDLLLAYKKILAGSPESEDKSVVRAQVGELSLARPSSYAIPIKPPAWNTNRTGSLSLLTAGRRSGPRGDEFHAYADAVRTFDWDDFYKEWAGGAYMDFLRADLSSGRPANDPSGPLTAVADIVLLDSRTGVTEHGGVATHHLADIVVVLSAANDLNLDGATWMANALARPDLKEVRGGRPLNILPVASRIEQTSERDLVGNFRRKFQVQFSQYVPGVMGVPKEFFIDTEIPYVPFYSFTERVAAREQPMSHDEKMFRDELLFRKYEALAHALVECGVSMNLLPISSVPSTVRLRQTTRIVEPPRGVFGIRRTNDNVQAAGDIATALGRAGVAVTHDLDLASAPQQEKLSDLSGVFVLVGPATPPGWVRAEVDDALRKQAANPEFRIVPVIVGEASVQALQHLNRLRTVTIDPHVLERDTSALVAAVAARMTAAPETPGTASFLGLQPYKEEDARFFFGREQALSDLAAKCASIGRPRWIQITGAPGVGKTSFVHAAIIPALRRGLLVPSITVGKIASLRFAADPVAELTGALAAITQGPAPLAKIHTTIAQGSGLSGLLRELAPGGETLVIFADDCDAPNEPPLAPVLRQLKEAAADPAVPLLLITAGRRGDESSPAVQGTLRYEVQPITPDQWVAVAKRSAQLTGVTWEPAALDAFARDATALGKSALWSPLLGALLYELWTMRGGASISESVYRQSGGPLAVLVRNGDMRLAQLPDKERAAARAVLTGLVLDRQGTEGLRTISRAEARALAREAPRPDELLAKLAAAPPLIALEGDQVRLAHPGLVKDWPELREWISEAKTSTFQRTRKIAIGLFAAAAVLIVALLTAEKARDFFQARTRMSQGLAAEALRTQDTDPLRGLVLAVASANTETDESRAALEGALANKYPRLVLEHPAPVNDAAFSRDTARIVAASGDSVRIWEPLDRQVAGAATSRTIDVNDGKITSLGFSPDGRLVGVTTVAGSAVVLDLEKQATVLKQAGGFLDGAFSVDGRAFLTAGLDGNVSVWAVPSGTSAQLSGHSAAVTSISTQFETGRIVTTSLDGSAFVREPPSYAPVTQIAAPEMIGGITTGALGGRAVALAGPGGLVLKRENYPVDVLLRDNVTTMAFAQTGRLLAAAHGATIHVWILDSPADPPRAPLELILARGKASDAVVTDLAVDNAGRQVAAGTSDGRVYVWEPAVAVEAASLRAHTAGINRVRFSDDGRQLLSASDDNTVCVWDFTPRAPVAGRSFESLRSEAQSIVDRLFTPAQLAALTR